jgi:hypothetical protein
MGSPLGPLFANIFMDEFEQKHINKLRELGVVTWNRYVDDVFATINNKEQCQQILEYLNNQHPNIKFTVEKERNNKLAFLDTSVSRKHNKLSTCIYHKPTFTGVYLNWTSLTARKYKISLIYCLCDRIWKICKDPTDRELEFHKLKLILQKNEYPEAIVDKEINKFKTNRTEQTEHVEPEEQQPTEQNIIARATRRDELTVSLFSAESARWMTYTVHLGTESTMTSLIHWCKNLPMQNTT